MTTVTASPIVAKRYDFVFLYDVVQGNPNGDPDAGNSPRVDPETGHGLVSDVAIKRKIRNFVSLAKSDIQGSSPEPGYDIYVKQHGVLEQLHRHAYQVLGLKTDEKSKDTKVSNVEKARAWMCQTYFDIRTFGAVLTLDINCGQVRGPVQITFSRSFDPIMPLDQSITRRAVATQREADAQIEKSGQVVGTMGRKEIVPYALYCAHGFISPHLAADTGFTEADLDLVWQALLTMFESDRSASRGEMATRKLIVFEHDSPLGNAPAHPPRPRRSSGPFKAAQELRGVPDYRRLSRSAGRGNSARKAVMMQKPADDGTLFSEDDLLPLSALQHLLFCERQAALIHLERLWAENPLTIEGQHLHEKADSALAESRGSLRLARAIPLRNLRLGLVGKSDLVEFHRLPAGSWVLFFRGSLAFGAHFPSNISEAGPKSITPTKFNSVRKRFVWRRCWAPQSSAALSIMGRLDGGTTSNSARRFAWRPKTRRPASTTWFHQE
jgi:CRISPR-associated protein Csd2